MPDSDPTPALPKPAIVLDFDHVLFDTDAYNSGIRQAMKEIGIDRAHWDAAYQNRDPDGVLRLTRLFKQLAERSSRSVAQIQAAFDQETAESMWYLYADAREFLEQFREAAEVYLLSFGCKEWQHQKIDAVGIRNFFTHVTVVEEPKSEARDVPVPSVAQAIFINDSRQEMLELARRYRWAKHLHINRTGEELPADFPFPSYPDLRSAAPAIAASVGLTLVRPEAPPAVS